MNRLSYGKAFLISFAISALSWAQEAQPPSVMVSQEQGQLAVRIIAATDLSAVLQRICKENGLECQLDGIPSGAQIAPQLLSGSFEKVMAQLLEGSGVDYALVPPGGGSRGSVLIKPRPASQENLSIPTGAAPLALAASRSVNDVSVETAKSDNRVETPAWKSQATDGEASTSSSADAAPASAPEGFGTSPFTDSSGKPVYFPLDGARSAYLPFPDRRGNLMPAPTTNNPPQYLPFPDANGNPIPAPAVSQHTPENPFPSTLNGVEVVKH